jgi:voltage-gated potassium channel
MDNTRTDPAPPRLSPWRERGYQIIFEADTPAGRLFDILLIIAIFASVLVVMLESVDRMRLAYGPLLYNLEWLFTILFTIEYALRLIVVRRPLRYARSFFGIVDLLSIIPTYLSLFVGGLQTLLVIRVFRLLRLFRVFKLVHYVAEANVLVRALHASRPKITVFLGAVLSITTIAGALMYLVEGPEAGFTSIPKGMYWAIVTLTTVGFGDITPLTPLGQALASLLMILGYGVIAVPTGIVSVELARATNPPALTQACPTCGREGHDSDAIHCKYCGGTL